MYEARSAEHIRIYESIAIDFILRLKIHRICACAKQIPMHYHFLFVLDLYGLYVFTVTRVVYRRDITLPDSLNTNILKINTVYLILFANFARTNSQIQELRKNYYYNNAAKEKNKIREF